MKAPFLNLQILSTFLFISFLPKLCIRASAGGIIGLGEAVDDWIGLLHTLATLPTHPESVPINALVPVKGTPLQDQKVNLILYNQFSIKYFWHSSSLFFYLMLSLYCLREEGFPPPLRQEWNVPFVSSLMLFRYIYV